MKIDRNEPLHATLARLHTATTPDILASVLVQLTAECLGAAVLDTGHEEPTLLHMSTVNEHPDELKQQLGRAFGEMIDGPEVRRLMAMWGDLGRHTTIDGLGFDTGPVTHDMKRLASDPNKVLVVVTPKEANIRTTALALGRVAESAVLA